MPCVEVIISEFHRNQNRRATADSVAIVVYLSILFLMAGMDFK